MSTDPGNSANTSVFENTTHTDAVAIAGCIMAGLIALVILRFCVNILIDVVILQDFDSVRRSFGAIIRRVCPWWHRRTQPEIPATDQNENTIEIQATLRGRHLEERTEIIASILKDKMLSSADVEGLRGNLPEPSTAVDEECSTSSKCVCSICLIEFETGDHVVTAEKCSHTYHQHCIVEWLGSHGTDCPYCRRQMISMESLEAASAARTHSA